jgi:CheY-specific phosphatase CheX
MVEIETVDLLSRATQEVLETMFFTDVLGTVEFPRDCTEPFVAARARFRGEPSGSVGLCVSAAAARIIAANFLGEEETLTSRQVQDVIAELVNMVCGSVVSRLESHTSFEIRHPEPTSAESVIEEGATKHCYELDDGILAVTLSLQPNP